MARTGEQIETHNPILTPDKAFHVFDRQVRTLMGSMTGDEFIGRWNAGEFDAIADPPGHRHIIRLSLMIPGGYHKS